MRSIPECTSNLSGGRSGRARCSCSASLEELCPPATARAPQNAAPCSRRTRRGGGIQCPRGYQRQQQPARIWASCSNLSAGRASSPGKVPDSSGSSGTGHHQPLAPSAAPGAEPSEPVPSGTFHTPLRLGRDRAPGQRATSTATSSPRRALSWWAQAAARDS